MGTVGSSDLSRALSAGFPSVTPSSDRHSPGSSDPLDDLMGSGMSDVSAVDSDALLDALSAPAPSDDDERSFVEEKRAVILKRLGRWKEDYQPAPGYLASYSRTFAGIVKVLCTSAIDQFLDDLGHVTTRPKLFSVLLKNKRIMLDNRCIMNSATANKTDEACDFVDAEVAELLRKGLDSLPSKDKDKMVTVYRKYQTTIFQSPSGYCNKATQEKLEQSRAVFEPLMKQVVDAHKDAQPKQDKALDPNDPLFQKKSATLEAIRKWKQDFHPAPLWTPVTIPGFQQLIDNSAERIFGDMVKAVRKATTEERILKIFVSNIELIRLYRSLVNQPTADKLDAIVKILDTSANS